MLLVALLAGGYFQWQSTEACRRFGTLAAAGQTALSNVETFPSQGRHHLLVGQTYVYQARFPTSGPHDPVPTPPGFYTTHQRPETLVHSLEHGNIVIYYDEPGEAALRSLREWTRRFDGRWDGVIGTPFSGLGEAIVLTAWTKMLRLDRFDKAAAAAFIDAFRGRGPEKPVR